MSIGSLFVVLFYAVFNYILLRMLLACIEGMYWYFTVYAELRRKREHFRSVPNNNPSKVSQSTDSGAGGLHPTVLPVSMLAKKRPPKNIVLDVCACGRSVHKNLNHFLVHSTLLRHQLTAMVATLPFAWTSETQLCLATALLQFPRGRRPYNAPHGEKAAIWTNFQATLLNNNCFTTHGMKAPIIDTVKRRVTELLYLSLALEVFYQLF